MTLEHFLTAGVVGFSIIAGAAWFLAATVKINVPKQGGKIVDFRETIGDEPGDNQLVVDGVDVWRTSALQGRWNATAAAAACVAALLQAWQASLHW
ncbi:hypothetical protein [Bradyrhizobium zhanjiangense]|uniref:hypothetical protein n=1 Tax=Bradyrhizobium zhanjiangense TaxID=1325107 RepID=UPI001008A461|nr:hypothetical protein [Bradyrhizobium zhanjiangense]